MHTYWSSAVNNGGHSGQCPRVPSQTLVGSLKDKKKKKNIMKFTTHEACCITKQFIDQLLTERLKRPVLVYLFWAFFFFTLQMSMWRAHGGKVPDAY